MRQVLACHDGSEEATQGVLQFLREQPQGIVLTVFHVLEPFPPALLEHEGSEDPDEEERLDSELRQRRKLWVRDHVVDANRAFRPALMRMGAAVDEEGGVSLKLLPADDDADFFLFLKAEATSGAYDDVVIPHRPNSWLRRLLTRSAIEELKTELTGVNVEIVEVSA